MSRPTRPAAATSTIQTILLDQIFGVNLDQTPPNPINTFHVGFWFNNPDDAKGCGFDPTKPTPFNGEHRAGPLAMISVPDAPRPVSARSASTRTPRSPAAAIPDRTTSLHVPESGGPGRT